MSVAAYDYKTISQQIIGKLRSVFPNDTIETREGYQGRTHVLVVSSMFNGTTERQKQDLFWEILRAEVPDFVDAVSVAIVYGTDEL
jgi:hypothetical protein